MTTNKKVLDFIAQTQELCQPAKIVWIDGSEEQIEALHSAYKGHYEVYLCGGKRQRQYEIP